MRGAGGASGAAGRVATGAAGGALAEIIGGAGGGATAAGGGTGGRIGGGAMGAATGLSTGGAITPRGGAATGGATTVAAGADTGGFGAGGATAGRGGTAMGFSAAGGTTAGCVGAAATSFFCVIAFKTSPGREMCDRSILVLISSSPLRAARAAALLAEVEPSEFRKCTRTFSASKSSSELECVFFSVTPTCVSTSRMALLLTSSSRARSLIRTLLIRPFVAPCFS